MFFFLRRMYVEGVGFVRVIMVMDLIRSLSFIYDRLHSGRKLGGECGHIAQVHHRGALPLLEL